MDAQCPGCLISLPPGLPADTIYIGNPPDGEVGVPYDEDISFRMPQSTTPVAAIDPDVPPGLPISKIKITSVNNLPPGLSWEANKLTFNTGDGDTDGCVKFCGTPTLPDSFYVQVTVTATVFGIDQSSSFYLRMYVAPAGVTNDGFSMLNNVGCGSATVFFTNNIPSNGDPGFSYFWDFGNGNTSTLEDPLPQVYNYPGVYPVTYEATIDTAGYFLTGVTIVDTDCNDFNIPPADKPDLFILITSPGGTLLHTSEVKTNTDLPVTFFVNIPLGEGNYNIEVKDDELIGTEQCGSVNFNKTTTGLLIDGQLELTVTINHPVTVVNTVDSVYVFPVPDTPELSFASLDWCEGDIATLEVSNYNSGLQWYGDTLLLAGETGQVLEVSTPGNYWVVYTSPDGCTAGSEVLALTFHVPPALPIFDDDGNLLYVTNPPAGDDYSLQWYIEGEIIPGATGLTYCMTTEGTNDYTLEITDLLTGCTNDYTYSATFNPEEDCVSSVDDRFAGPGALRVFPNPVSSELNIEVEEMAAGQVEMVCFNALGQALLRHQVIHSGGAFSASIIAEALDSGWYVLLVKNQESGWMGRTTFIKAE